MNGTKAQLLVWWVLWASFQAGIFLIYHFIRTPDQPAPDPTPVWLAGAGPFVLSVAMRWLVLPRVASVQLAFPLFIVGISLAEATCFLGLFIFPAHRTQLFCLSAAGIFQFVPTFAARFFAETPAAREGRQSE
jgi:hypothetical protein